MLNLNRNHDPCNNADLITKITGKPLDIEEAVLESEQLFQQCLQKVPVPQPEQKNTESVPFWKKFMEGLFRLSAKPHQLLIPTQVYVDRSGNVYPDWKAKLDGQYNQLIKNFDREVSVTDFGAIGDGKTDCTAAFKKAIGNGRVKVKVPPGVYMTRGICLPSWTCLFGSGKRQTIIKLHDDAAKGTRLITNANHWRGNHHLYVEGMTLDWNIERLGDVEKTSTWGNHSSCLTYANVTYGWVKDVEGINPGLHCFDISSTLYNYAGDGYQARGGSQYVWLDNVTGYGFGDDGVTTHHSDYIFISNSHMCDPSGRAHTKGSSNSNGFEVDDGSRNILLVNNSSARCFGGIEIKAHQNSSAASNVQIVGHLSVKDNRSFNFRHIGHHKSTDSESKSAYNIVATNLVSIAPAFTDLYKDSPPRGMVVSGYKKVVVNHFTLIGDPAYDFQSNPCVAIQYRARNVVLKNVTISDFKNASAGIKVFGGENRADSVSIRNIEVMSEIKTLEIGSGLVDIEIEDVKEREKASQT
nr:glycoside hydrolase family 55 protein [Neobacillus sp. Marseille-Q6967]